MLFTRSTRRLLQMWRDVTASSFTPLSLFRCPRCSTAPTASPPPLLTHQLWRFPKRRRRKRWVGELNLVFCLHEVVFQSFCYHFLARSFLIFQTFALLLCFITAEEFDEMMKCCLYCGWKGLCFRFWGVFIEDLHACGLVLTSKYLCSVSTWQVSTAVLSITAKAKKKEKEKKEKEEEKMEVVNTHLFISHPEMIYPFPCRSQQTQF